MKQDGVKKKREIFKAKIKKTKTGLKGTSASRGEGKGVRRVQRKQVPGDTGHKEPLLRGGGCPDTGIRRGQGKKRGGGSVGDK